MQGGIVHSGLPSFADSFAIVNHRGLYIPHSRFLLSNTNLSVSPMRPVPFPGCRFCHSICRFKSAGCAELVLYNVPEKWLYN